MERKKTEEDREMKEHKENEKLKKELKEKEQEKLRLQQQIEILDRKIKKKTNVTEFNKEVLE